MKLNLGCGSNVLEGWENCDLRGPRKLDLRQLPLPFDDRSIDYILAEHVVEHLTQHKAFYLLEDCFRVLARGGVARVCVPSLERFAERGRHEHFEWLAAEPRQWCSPTRDSALRLLVFGHAHKSLWTAGLLASVMSAIGFIVAECEPGCSAHPALQDVEGHWRDSCREVWLAETAVVEGTKP